MPTFTLRSLLLLMACAGGLWGQAGQVPVKLLRLDGFRDWVWDQTRSRMFVSAGSSILMIEPESLSVEDTLAAGGLVETLAISLDGRYLYAGVGERARIERYDLARRVMDLEIPLTSETGARLAAIAIAPVPGSADSIVVGRSTWPLFNNFPLPVYDLAVYDGASRRGAAAAMRIDMLWAFGDGSIYGTGSGRIYRLSANADGIAVGGSTQVSTFFEPVRGNGSVKRLVSRQGVVFDLDSNEFVGKAALPTFGKAVGLDAAGASVVVAVDAVVPADALKLYRHSADTFRLTGSGELAVPRARLSVMAGMAFGTDGLLLRGFDDQGHCLYSLHTNTLTPVSPLPPAPRTDGSGITRLTMPANDLAFDARRNLLWVTVPGSEGVVGNSVVGIDPDSGRIVTTIPSGSDPGKMAMSGDGSRIFTYSTTVPVVSGLDLDAKQRVQKFAVVDDAYWNPLAVAAVPDAPDSVVVLRAHATEAYRMDIRMYDSGAPRPKTHTNVKPGVGLLEEHFTALYPGGSPSELYGADTEMNFGDDSHRLARFAMDADGISMVEQLNPLQLGSIGAGGTLVYEGGRLLTGAGELWTADATHLEGRLKLQETYAGAGIPVPLPERNQVVYATYHGLDRTASVTLFDLSTMRPLSTLQFPATVSTILRPPPLLAVRVGADRIAMARDGEILLIPLRALRPWAQPSTVVRTAGPGVRRIDLKASWIAPLPGTAKIVASTPNTEGELGNSVLTIDPGAGRVESAVFVGSEPWVLAPTADGSAVWVSLNGQRRIARMDLMAKTRDRLFIADPKGGTTQWDVHALGMAPDGGLTVSYLGGPIAIFDDTTVRPEVDWNTEGETRVPPPATYRFAYSGDGSTLYAFNGFLSTFEFKRARVSATGVKWLSHTEDLISGYGQGIWEANGLIYTDRGYAVDPEGVRRVGRFVYPDALYQLASAIPHPAAGRIYFLVRSILGAEFALAVFDIHTYEFLGALPLAIADGDSLTSAMMVRYSEDGIAVTTGKALFFVQLSAIPLRSAPVASPPLPPLPSTPGVTVVDLEAAGLAYDAANDVLYATVPNREGARGDQIAAIDPETGEVKRMYPAGAHPRRLAVSDDGANVYYSGGWTANKTIWSFSFTPEGIRRLDPATGAVSESFGSKPFDGKASYLITDLVPLQGQPGSVAALRSRFAMPAAGWAAADPTAESVTVYDNGVARPSTSGAPAECLSLTAGASASRLYCGSSGRYTKLAVDGEGVRADGSRIALPMGNGYGFMSFYRDTLFTTAGIAVEAETGKVTGQTTLDGWPAAGDGRVYWMQIGHPFQSPWTAELRSFDAATLDPIATRKIATTKGDMSELVWCGKGRLAFRAGHEIYIVKP